MELTDYLRIFRAHWLGVLAITAAIFLATAGWVLLQPKVYTADTNGIVSSAGSEDVGSSYTTNSLAGQRIASYVELGSSRSVADYAIGELNLDTTPEDLVKRVKVTNPTDTLILKVSAEASTPETARDLAEAWMRGMVREVNFVEAGDEATTGALFLAPRDSARLPAKPSSPNVERSLALGLLLGLMLGTGYAFVRSILDRRIRSAEGVEQATGLSVVGSLPQDKSVSDSNALNASGKASREESFALAEALRTLRTNLQFMDVDNPPRVIVISSPLPADGKSTVSSRLASSLAENGERVVLIDADLRRPTLSKIFNLPTGAGLTDVLAGRAAFGDVSHHVGDSGNLLVLTAGSIPPNPAEVLGSERMQGLLASLRDHALVILDAPPLVPVTDAAVLSARADGALVVASVGSTTYEVLGKAHENLERVNARTLGVVLNKVPRKGAGAAQYGYQYYGTYYEGNPKGTPRDRNGQTTSRTRRHSRARR